MIFLKFYKPKDFEDLNYNLSELQMEFTATLNLVLERIKERELNSDFFSQPISIFLDEKPVGFFVLDLGEDKFGLTENPDSILVRSFSVNPKFQGEGIGKSAMFLITDFVKNNFPKVNEIILSVNERNELAYQIYLKTGFHFFGKIISGKSGLQKILCKKI
ncbi:GNAT family N-acetyltransferase [Halpernia sp.]|uniref:GNAT family N-acetyltransferase n=1 Tax=Halpernia sp. TaxID=2782209 RepID=UPI003A95287A